jgi:hypothetical protein
VDVEDRGARLPSRPLWAPASRPPYPGSKREALMVLAHPLISPSPIQCEMAIHCEIAPF